jgi:hypothetical protein
VLTSRSTRELLQGATGAARRQTDVPGGSGLQAVEPFATLNPKTKGGMSAMAKKAAKGGKKKAGKKR